MSGFNANPGHESKLWRQVVFHLQEAKVACLNALGHNLEDPTLILELDEKIDQARDIARRVCKGKGIGV